MKQSAGLTWNVWWIWAGACLLLSAVTGVAQTDVRIATYNIKFLDAQDLPSQGDRENKLEEVVESLQADIIALQEIDDRAALEMIFDPSEWWLIMDDDSGHTQDLAVAVRRHLGVPGFDAADQDADDEDFLFPGVANNSPFPNRRDVLHVEVGIPDEDLALHVLVVHAKSRFGGRATTDPRREHAARLLLQRLEQEFDDDLYVLLGDFNDSPDDRSLNILESGSPHAAAGPEEIQGPFLINLTEPLWADDHVSHGRKSNELTPDASRVDLVDPGSRDRNNSLRGTDAHTGDILFDQILIPPSMLTHYQAGSTAVFDLPVAVLGNNTTRASDHLPVFADFSFSTPSPPPTHSAVVQITALLPNPSGQDAGNEQVTLRNTAATAIDLTGWYLQDRAGNTFELPSVTIEPGGELVIIMDTFSMPLNNGGDDVMLWSADTLIDSVSYLAHEVVPGQQLHILR